MNSDHELINRILDGDVNAFKELVADYQKLVSHVIGRMISNQSDGEEIAQDVFVKVYQNLSKFQFNSKLSTWIAKITYNTCINHLQKKKVKLYDDDEKHFDRTINSDNQSNGIENVTDDSDYPDQILEQSERNEVLQKAIKDLPVQQRTIVTLFHLDEMSYKEISDVMNLPEGTVKSHLFRARKMLKNMLLQQYQLEEI